MAEVIKESSNPLEDAIEYVLLKRSSRKTRATWKLLGWVSAGLNHPVVLRDIHSKVASQKNPGTKENVNLVAGVTIAVTYPDETVRNVTIRHDYDFASQPGKPGYKGYHVNVALPDEKLAFVDNHGHQNGKDKFNACCLALTREKVNLGDEAAKWFMRESDTWTYQAPDGRDPVK